MVLRYLGQLAYQLIFSFFFLHNMLGNVELNVDTTNNHPAVTSYFANPSFKKIVLLPFGNPSDFLEVLTMFY